MDIAVAPKKSIAEKIQWNIDNRICAQIVPVKDQILGIAVALRNSIADKIQWDICNKTVPKLCPSRSN